MRATNCRQPSLTSRGIKINLTLLFLATFLFWFYFCSGLFFSLLRPLRIAYPVFGYIVFGSPTDVRTRARGLWNMESLILFIIFDRSSFFLCFHILVIFIFISIFISSVIETNLIIFSAKTVYSKKHTN